jgi:hypothetical protein
MSAGAQYTQLPETLQKEKVSPISIKKAFIVICGCALLTGCASKRPNYEWVARKPGTGRIQAPPEGKALVNFHRIGGAFTFALCNRDGAFLCDVPPYGEFQYLCDPGEQVFIGWLLQSPVSVVQAQVDAGKVYDILIFESAWERPHLVPLSNQDPRRAHLTEYEAQEDLVSLNRLLRVAKSEAQVQPKIEEIRRDFLGGPKSDRFQKLGKDDCR